MKYKLIKESTLQERLIADLVQKTAEEYLEVLK